VAAVIATVGEDTTSKIGAMWAEARQMCRPGTVLHGQHDWTIKTCCYSLPAVDPYVCSM
jgi:hypothetical protein